MSANYHTDIQNTAGYYASISTTTGTGPLVGQWVDMSNTDSYCNLYFAAGGASGPFYVAVQTAPGLWDVPFGGNSFSGSIFSGGSPASGSFTDPTSGLAQLPTNLNSGGIWIVNSGVYTTPGGGGASGQLVNGAPIFTLPFGPNVIQNGMGATFISSGAYPALCSGGLAFAAFQRNYQYARLVLLSGVSVAYIQAGFIAQKDTTGSGGGFSYGPNPNSGVNV